MDVLLAVRDIGLPGMDGYEVARSIRSEKLNSQPYLVALTRYGQESDRREADEAGFDQHLVKPAGIQDLEEVFTATSERRRG